MAHHQQRMILTHLVAAHQQQLVLRVDRPVIHLLDRSKQRGAVDHPVAHQIDRAQERLEGHSLAQLQQIAGTGLVHQRQCLQVGLLGLIQHALKQGSRLVGGGAGVALQLLLIAAVHHPAPRQQWQGQDQQGTAKAPSRTGKINPEQEHSNHAAIRRLALASAAVK
ncbi:hypothetical protein D3C80_1215860 [compost metagenome]